MMKVSTYEKFLEENRGREWYPDKLKSVKERYPFTVMVEGHYPESDFATRWCWQQFGPYHADSCCEYASEYPACPLVLAIEEYVIKKSYVKDGVTHEYDYHTRDPGKHSHEGTWTYVWLGKTGYDYGFTEYCFLNEADRDAFLAAAPSLTFGENYED